MQDQDKKAFAEMMYAVADVYEKEMSPIKLKVYFGTLAQYSIEQVREAVSKHMSNTDTGSFMPKPADLIRSLDGTKKEAEQNLQGTAEMQWLNVYNAIGRYGTYNTPKLDDPVTRACITAIGGWSHICSKTVDELKWVGKEFVSLYQNMHNRPLDQLPDNVKGLEDMQHMKQGASETLKTIVTNVEKLQNQKDD